MSLRLSIPFQKIFFEFIKNTAKLLTNTAFCGIIFMRFLFAAFSFSVACRKVRFIRRVSTASRVFSPCKNRERKLKIAGVLELADKQASDTCVFNMRVQVPSPAPTKNALLSCDKGAFFEWCLPSANDVGFALWCSLREWCVASPHFMANIASFRHEVAQHHIY